MTVQDIKIETLNAITEQVIKCAIEVHRQLGPGLLESIYEKALLYELKTLDLRCECQVPLPIIYNGEKLGEQRIDMIAGGEVIVELKAVERMDPVFEAQLLSYLRLTKKKVGLLINFNVPALRLGIKRMVL